MLDYNELMSYIETKLFGNFAIAMMAIVLWIIKAPTINNNSIGDIMTALGFTFDTSTAVLTIGETTYTVYQAIEFSIINLFRKEEVINPPSMSNSIRFAFDMEYITAAERDALKDLLNAA